MPITEPVTTLTDYLLALMSLFFAVQLFRISHLHQQTSVLLWALAMAATAAAALFGGTFHGFALSLDEAQKAAIWKATVYSVGLASLLMLSGTILASISRPLRQWLLAAAAAKFLVFALWMATHDDFQYVIYDYAGSMLGVLLLQVLVAYPRAEVSAAWIIAGILASFGAAGVQISGFRRHQHFNHNDLYHVIQMAALYLLYRGAGVLKDQ